MRPLAEPMAGPSQASLRAWERHLGREVDLVALRAELADGTLTEASYLASPQASFINGAHIPIDGGQREAIMDAGAQAVQA